MTVLCRKNICVKASQMVWHQYEPFFQHLLPLVQSLSPVWVQPHEVQHARLPCPSLSPGVFSNSCLLIGDANLTISSSATPFFCLQSFPAPGSFPISQLFSSAGQSIGASTTVLPMNIQGWFPLGLTGMISLQSKGLSSSTIYYNYFLSRQIKIFSWSFNTKL